MYKLAFRKYIQTNPNTDFFINVLEPILLSCRINPHILIETRDRELNIERMKEKRADDLFSLCEKVSIEESDLNSYSFKQQINQHFYGLDTNSLDDETFACFERGYRALGTLFWND
jgi:hypothetical protein